MLLVGVRTFSYPVFYIFQVFYNKYALLYNEKITSLKKEMRDIWYDLFIVNLF